MFKFLFSFYFISALWFAPHSPDVSSTMLVEQKDGTWVLQIRSALTAFKHFF